MPQKLTVKFTHTASEHLASYKRLESNIILDAVKAELPFQPTKETRNRKLLRHNPLADWELRVQKYRVSYEVDSDQQVLRIVAVGHKEHNKLFIGSEEIDLSANQLSVDELLESARTESVIVTSADGTSFVLSVADELTTEIELLRRNHKFLALLDDYKQDQRSLSLEEVEGRLQ